MSLHAFRRAALSAVATLALVAPAAHASHTGPDYVASDNVQYVTSDRLPGDGVGARVVGKYLYVTTTTGLTIYDIQKDPAHPAKVGFETMDVEFENEEVPTNGKILGISGQDGCSDPWSSNITGTMPNQLDPNSTYSASESTGCLTLWNVSDPNNVQKIKVVPGAGEHTTACAYDCQWLYGSTGAITDNRDPKNAHVVGNWQKAAVGGSKYFKSSCHHLREIQPGVLLGSCQPILLLSLRPEDGGSPTKPVVLATGTNSDNRFIHSGQWPNHGTDKFTLEGGETNFQPSCTDQNGAFMVWDASGVRDGNGGFRKGGVFKEISEVRASSGTYSDGHAAAFALGCSVHWFEQHPSFHDGGLVALAEYEDGTRFEQITSTGKIIEQGFFLPMGGATSAPHWNPFDPHYLYTIDYARGLDVLRYTGDTYVPAQPASGTPGTNGSKQSRQAVKAKHARHCARLRKRHPHRKHIRGCPSKKHHKKHKKHK